MAFAGGTLCFLLAFGIDALPGCKERVYICGGVFGGLVRFFRSRWGWVVFVFGFCVWLVVVFWRVLVVFVGCFCFFFVWMGVGFFGSIVFCRFGLALFLLLLGLGGLGLVVLVS